MRDTQHIITSHSTYQKYNGPLGTYGKISFPSPSACVDWVNSHPAIQKDVGGSWRNNPSRAGLNNQSLTSYDQTKIAQTSLELTQKAKAKLPEKRTRLAQPHMAVTGGYWDTPSVIAGLPLSARTRKRAKLAPMNIRLSFFFSAGIDAASMAPSCAEICKAIWDYTLAGGAVNLTVFHVEGPDEHNNRNTGTKGCIVETKVNCSDVASLTLALSPVYMRLTAFCIQSGHSDSGSGVPYPSENPVANALFIGGRLEAVHKAVATVRKQLSITA